MPLSPSFTRARQTWHGLYSSTEQRADLIKPSHKLMYLSASLVQIELAHNALEHIRLLIFLVPARKIIVRTETNALWYTTSKTYVRFSIGLKA